LLSLAGISGSSVMYKVFLMSPDRWSFTADGVLFRLAGISGSTVMSSHSHVTYMSPAHGLLLSLRGISLMSIHHMLLTRHLTGGLLLVRIVVKRGSFLFFSCSSHELYSCYKLNTFKLFFFHVA
jgi:hypothetical protein